MKPANPNNGRTVYSVRLSQWEAATIVAALRLRAEVLQAQGNYNENQDLYRYVASEIARQLAPNHTQQEFGL